MPDSKLANSIIEEVIAWLKQNRGEKRFEQDIINSSQLNQTLRIRGEKGTYIVKLYERIPHNFFECERLGLAQLKDSGVRVPNVYHCTKHWILLEAIPTGLAKPKFWEDLAEQLHTLHSCQSDVFGLKQHNYIGNMPQMNTQMADGYQFFEECRIMPQTKWAYDAKKIGKNDLSAIESICSRLKELVPEQPAVLLHGDLWSGNILCDTVGNAYFIDPAVYFGWAETDLAMTQLFGGVDEDVYIHYQESCDMNSSWKQRAPLYNLYHLLNHLNLFGRSYYSSVTHVLKVFS